METKRITLPQADKTSTTVYANLSDVSTPIGSILLLHDLAEHHGRFDDFSRVLTGKGYDTYSYDHRGHGSGIRFEELGFISDDKGYELLISDALHILQYIKKTNRGRKLILFGQGLGALIARCVIQAFDDIDACILCSSPNPPLKTISSMLTAAKFIRFRKKAYHRSVYLAKKFTEFKSFAKISNRTAYDWISRDNQLVGSYISDPLCQFVGTVSFYIDILNLMDTAVARTNLKQVRNDLPILVLAGSHDPVCDYGDDATELFDTYQRYHFSEVDCTIYEEARHDLLHETNNGAIMKDILEWLNTALDNRRLRAVAAMKAKKKQRKGSHNRTAAEAARSALGYASDTEDSSFKGSIQADNVGDDDDFLDDMGYFAGRNSIDNNESDDFEDFIIMDDDEDFDNLTNLEDDDSTTSEDMDVDENKKGKGKKNKAKKDKKSGSRSKESASDSTSESEVQSETDDASDSDSVRGNKASKSKKNGNNSKKSRSDSGKKN